MFDEDGNARAVAVAGAQTNSDDLLVPETVAAMSARFERDAILLLTSYTAAQCG
jgi:hypothetical protein